LDGAGWWNTKGILGKFGRVGLSRGFPATHYFAQARIAFAVASARCQEVFSPPGCFTLWNLTPEIEESVDAHWQAWCRDGASWAPFFTDIADRHQGDLVDHLTALGLIDQATVNAVAQLRRGAEGKAVLLPGTGRPDAKTLMLLAAGFARGGKGQLSVPYLRAA